MRVLVTTTGSSGHLLPLIPFMEALRDRGDELLVATRASSVERVRATGFAVTPLAEAPAERRNAIFAELRELPTDEAAVRATVEVFAQLDARAAVPGLRAAVADWQPDLILQEIAEFGGGMVAAHHGIPFATAGIGLGSTEHVVLERLRPELAALADELGVPPQPGVPWRYITLAPPSLDVPGAPGAVRFRPRDPAPAAPLPDAWWRGAEGPLVYLTFGSVAPTSGFFPALYRAAIDALAALPVRVLVTTGRDQDPAELGPLPAGVHAERWIPQAQILPHASAMACHGGFGTVLGALSAGVPLAVLPLFADQPYNAARIAAVGAGIALERGPAGVGGLAGAVEALLDDAGYAERAAAIAADVRALPDVDAAAGLLAELAAEGASIQG